MSELPPVPAGWSVEQLWALVCELRRDNASLREVVEAQNARIAALERQVGKDCSTSSKPPSSDSPYRKPVRRCSRQSSGRRPGKQPGDPGTTMPLVDIPNEVITGEAGCCGGCGADLSGAPVVDVQRRQVIEVSPAPAPRAIEYQIVTRACAACGARASAPAPGSPPARVPYGPTVLARAAELVCAHYLPGARTARWMRSMVGVAVSVGFIASVRGRAARILEQTFLPRVRQLLGQAEVLPVDQTPARAAGGLEYVHVAATEYLTALHTGGRSATDIDAGNVPPGYGGTIVRDGYAGYAHLVDAHHAWCGAHLLRDLRAIHDADPDGQRWAAALATTLTEATTAAAAARAAGQPALDPEILATIRHHYRGAVTTALSDNRARAGPLAADSLALARRFRDHEDTILRFVVDLAVPFTNNQAQRDVRPVTIQQRTSGGAWRTLTGLADFAIVQPYLSTATQMATRHPRRPHPTLHRPALATTSPQTLLNSYRGRGTRRAGKSQGRPFFYFPLRNRSVLPAVRLRVISSTRPGL